LAALWAGVEECQSAASLRGVLCHAPAACCLIMPSADLDHNDEQVQKKLEWVTPKISLMESEATAGKAQFTLFEMPKQSGPS
jgi:hypothetical protein